MRRYLLELAERLGGMTADELGARMGASELLDWRALDEVRASEKPQTGGG